MNNTIQTYRGYQYLIGRPARIKKMVGLKTDTTWYYGDPDVYTVKVWEPGEDPDFSMDYQHYTYYFETRGYVERNIKRIINKLRKEKKPCSSQ